MKLSNVGKAAFASSGKKALPPKPHKWHSGNCVLASYISFFSTLNIFFLLKKLNTSSLIETHHGRDYRVMLNPGSYRSHHNKNISLQQQGCSENLNACSQERSAKESRRAVILNTHACKKTRVYVSDSPLAVKKDCLFQYPSPSWVHG